MNKEEVENAVLELWMKTQIPLTKAHVQYYTGEPRKRVETLLDELVVEGVLDVDVDDAGEMTYVVPGASRPPAGAKTFGEFERLKSGKKGAKKKPALEDDAIESLQNQMVLAQGRTMAKRLKKDIARTDGKKSLAVSTLASLTGPLGWLYAGSLKESIPAAILFLAVVKILPAFLLMPLLFVLLPASAIVGGVYAWQYNKTGERQPLLFKGGKDDDEKKKA